jgi:hypothetical protein
MAEGTSKANLQLDREVDKNLCATERTPREERFVSPGSFMGILNKGVLQLVFIHSN